jgi:hypothetical protein
MGCKMTLTTFPFDSQVCLMTVGSNAYTQSFMDLVPRNVGAGKWNTSNGTEVDYAYSTVDLSGYRQNAAAEFVITNVHVSAELVKYGCCPEKYPLLKFQFTFRRSTSTYVQAILLPLVIITMVSHFGMLMSSASGARTGLGITAVLMSEQVSNGIYIPVLSFGACCLLGRVETRVLRGVHCTL